MAWRLQQLAASHERILFICGMAHLERVRQLFDRPGAEPLTRIRREGVHLANLHPDSCREILGEFSFVSAIHEMRRGPLPPEPADTAHALRKRYNALELIAGGKQEVPEETALKPILWEWQDMQSTLLLCSFQATVAVLYLWKRALWWQTSQTLVVAVPVRISLPNTPVTLALWAVESILKTTGLFPIGVLMISLTCLMLEELGEWQVVQS